MCLITPKRKNAIPFSWLKLDICGVCSYHRQHQATFVSNSFGSLILTESLKTARPLSLGEKAPLSRVSSPFSSCALALDLGLHLTGTDQQLAAVRLRDPSGLEQNAGYPLNYKDQFLQKRHHFRNLRLTKHEDRTNFLQGMCKYFWDTHEIYGIYIYIYLHTYPNIHTLINMYQGMWLKVNFASHNLPQAVRGMKS